MELLDHVSCTVMERTAGRQRPSPIGAVGSNVLFVDLHGGRLLSGNNPRGVVLRSVVEEPVVVLGAQVCSADLVVFFSMLCATTPSIPSPLHTQPLNYSTSIVIFCVLDVARASLLASCTSFADR
jgi:hypothetical protein